MNSTAAKNHKTILLCDDNLLNRTLVTAILNGAPYRIMECDNGRDCIALALDRQNRVDLVLVDIGLKDINGIQVCQAIREGMQVHIPIIAYTAHAMDDERRHFLTSGFSDVLTKPIVRDDLLDILKKHLP